MKTQQSNKKVWIGIILLLVIFVASSFFIQSKQPVKYPPYLSDSPSPTGVKAFYTYLKNETGAVQRWSRTPNRLPKEKENQLLIMVEPFFIPESDEMKAYEQFMEAGNTILLFQENPEGMFGLSTDYGAFEQTDDDDDRVYTQYARNLDVTVKGMHRLQSDSRDQILFADHAGPIALKRTFGDGQLIVSLGPEWITNRKILDKDNVPYIISLLNEGGADAYLFDEYVHGGKGFTAQLTVYPLAFMLFMFQCGILAILWLWYKGKRFGPIFIPREATVRFSDEGVQALAAWYMRGSRYHDSLVIQADYVKHALQERWYIPYHKEWPQIGPLLELKWKRVPKAEIQPFLTGLSTVLTKEKISKQEYLLWSKRLNRLRSEVEDH